MGKSEVESMSSLVTKSKNRRAQKKVDLNKLIEESVRLAELDEDVEFKEELVKGRKGNTWLDRINRNLRNGKVVKPCGHECREWGKMVITSSDHKSMFYAEILNDDEEFLLKMARIAPSPLECKNFFYYYINEYLKKNKEFRLKFLKALYLNENLYTKEDIEFFVETYGFQSENELITADESFYEEVKENFAVFYPLPEKNWNNIEEKKAIRQYTKMTAKMNDEFELRLLSLLSLFKKFHKTNENSNKNEKIGEKSIEEIIIPDFAEHNEIEEDDDDLKDFYIPDDGSWKF